MSSDQVLSYPPATRRLRLGMVGGGNGLVGQWHWNGVRLSNRWELVAGALSSDPKRAKEYGQEWLLPQDRIYSDFHQMAQAESARQDGIDAVAICTPNWTHFEIAKAFMSAGIDVICDKPIAMNKTECQALHNLQQKTGVVFAVTHPYPYHPMVRQAKAMIGAGMIGELTQVMVEYAQDNALNTPADDGAKANWRLDPQKVGRTSVTGDIGTHAFQILEYVTGEKVRRLRADFHICGAAKPMEDTAFINVEMDKHAPGLIWITQAAAGNACGLRWRIFGRKGSLSWDQETPELLIYSPLDAPAQTFSRGHGAGIFAQVARMITLPRGHGEALSDAWANLYREAALAIEARRHGFTLSPGLIDLPQLDTGIRGVAFIDAAADSHEAGGAWVSMS